MKKWNYLLSTILIAGTVFVTSCSKDESTGPTLTLKGGTGYVSTDQTISAGETITVGAIAEAGSSNLNRFKFTSTFNNVPALIMDTTINTSSFNQDFELTFSAASVGANRLLVEVWDKDGNKAEKAFTVTVETGATPVNKYSGVLFGSFNDAIGSFYNSSENKVYTVAEAKANQAKVDLLYYFGAQHKNTLAAPDDADVNAEISTFQLNTWTTKNATRFLKGVVTAAQFDAIVDDFDFPAFNDATAVSNADQLAEGDVVYFKTVAGKLGLAKVVNVTSRGDQATFDFIIQE